MSDAAKMSLEEKKIQLVIYKILEKQYKQNKRHS